MFVCPDAENNKKSACNTLLRHVSACRAYGCDAPVGLVYGINPFMIIFMVPFVGALTTNFAHFDMIHYGSYISALSPFWIVAFPDHGDS